MWLNAISYGKSNSHQQHKILKAIHTPVYFMANFINKKGNLNQKADITSSWMSGLSVLDISVAVEMVYFRGYKG